MNNQPIFNLNDTVTFTEKTFTLLKQRVSRVIRDRLGATAIDKLDLQSHTMREVEGMLYDLTTYVLADKLVDDTYTAYHHWEEPASWWQMLKRDKAPKWFTDKWPVKYEQKSAPVTVKFERYATYPKANESVQNNKPLLVRFGGLEVMKDVVHQL